MSSRCVFNSPDVCVACSWVFACCTSSSLRLRTPSEQQKQTGSRRSQTGPWRWRKTLWAATSWPRYWASSWSARSLCLQAAHTHNKARWVQKICGPDPPIGALIQADDLIKLANCITICQLAVWSGPQAWTELMSCYTTTVPNTSPSWQCYIWALVLTVNLLEHGARSGGNEETVCAHERLANHHIWGAITISPCATWGVLFRMVPWCRRTLEKAPNCFTRVSMVTCSPRLFQADNSAFSVSLCSPRWLHLRTVGALCRADSRGLAGKREREEYRVQKGEI